MGCNYSPIPRRRWLQLNQRRWGMDEKLHLTENHENQVLHIHALFLTDEYITFDSEGKYPGAPFTIMGEL